ncbi:hypothetical protein [Massilia soli]|uniref:Uncharacterized protein n=1 Tax=Massilia soli TaxID=2792854 RepID=A0ABS7SRL7_9BURK|nr:hypothetical protein [Massilia soli]MBZ2208593.1 hypothetical protein [Massilia soli]
MSMQYFVWLGVALVVAIGGVMILQRRKSDNASHVPDMQSLKCSPISEVAQTSVVKPFETKQSLPHAIVLGENAQRPGIRIAPLSDGERYRAAKTLPTESGLGTRLSAGLQAVPALLVEEGHRGKHLMEVVINGELVRAKDGESLRAFSVGADNKISEHAKLFETNNLQNVVNAAAVWQIASVVVAQKHLADISAKLDSIRESVQVVVAFLDEERRAKVTGTFKYLERAIRAIAKGELSPAMRIELESCERELLQIQDHLQNEFKRHFEQTIEHKEFAGTGDLEKKVVNKYEKLRVLAMDLRLTLKTRALAWHVASLFPGEPGLKQVRMEELLRDADEIEGWIDSIDVSAKHDSTRFNSFWNKEETLNIRRTNIREAAQALATDLRDVTSQAKAEVSVAHASLLTHDEPIYLVFEVENGHIGEFRVAEPIARTA